MKQDQNRRRLCLVLKNASFGRKDAVIPACGAPKGYLKAIWWPRTGSTANVCVFHGRTTCFSWISFLLLGSDDARECGGDSL